MNSPTPIHNQILAFLRQYSLFTDLRHIKTLAAMVGALLSSQKLTLSEWEAHVPCKALQAQLGCVPSLSLMYSTIPS
jgi:hypothetical protein